MQKKPKIVQYRERLDNTLASPDLTNNEMLKTLVKSQLLRSSGQEVEGYKEKLVETKTAEVSNFLDMLRSASVDDNGRSNTSHTDWKLKQDTEEFRVMYREGPQGSPFHTLLVEGYVEGPIDVCLCISWETFLYKKWWPQFTVPSFKILLSECLQKVQIGEQISLVRVKLSWPLSTREAIVHYYVFEYFHDDLIVVLLNSVPESKSINGTLNGFNNDAIPAAKDVVRIDLVGGFALQKVTSERSYFRTIANMDIKLDFVPPSLINFISRQLIGNGFRLYQKAVASMMSHEKEFSQALGEPLYVRIREALYSISTSSAMDGEDLKQVASILPAEDLIQSKQDVAKDVPWEDRSNQYANNFTSLTMNAIVLDNSKAFGEIVEDSEEIVRIEEDEEKVHGISNEKADTRSVLKGKRNVYISSEVEQDSEEIVRIEDEEKVHDLSIGKVDTRCVLKGKRNVNISSEVEQALETLEEAISMVQKYGFHSCKYSSGIANEESPSMEKGGTVDSYSAKLIQQCLENEATVESSNRDTLEGSSQEAPGTNSTVQNLRHTGRNPNLMEVNYNKVVPASPEQNLSRPIEASQVASYSMKNGTTLDCTTCINKQSNTDAVQEMSSDDPKNSSRQHKLNSVVTQGISSDVPKKPSRRKKYLYCLFSALAKNGKVKTAKSRRK